MTIRPSLTLIALAGALLGDTIAAGAQTTQYPLPSSPATGTAQAQDGAHVLPGARRPNRIRAALRQLDLTNDQKMQIAGMLKSFRESRRTATPMTRKALIANIAGVLTPEQRTKMQALMRHRRPASTGQAPSAST